MTDWPLVGRHAELRRVHSLLTTSEYGGVVLAGPAGVGKTRLARECLAMARAAGHATSRITATQAAAGLPFGAFAPLLPEPVVGSAPGDGLSDLLVHARRTIAALGDGRTLVLLIDDAHLLDDSSATLALQLAATRAAFVIATVRSGETVPDPVVTLWKDGVAERLDLPPLGQEQIPALLEAVLGGPVDGATERYLVGRSGGNVLFLRELVLGALDAGVLRDGGGVWRMVSPAAPSARLVELVENRLHGLSDAERRVLETVAYGEPVGIDVLRSMIDTSPLEALERRGLLSVTREGKRLEARLAHPVHGDVLRRHIPVMRAEAVRRALADQVQGYGMRRRDDLMRVAAWRLDGGGGLPADLALAAADRAVYLCDLDLAERLARAAVASGGGFEPSLLVSWLIGHRRGDEADRALAALAPVARTDSERAALAVCRVDNLFMELGRVDEAMQVLDDAVATISDEESLAQVESKRAYLLLRTEHLRCALDVAEALLARASGRARIEACLVAGLAYPLAGRVEAALRAADDGESTESGGPIGPVIWHNFAHRRTRCETLAWAGRLDDAEVVAVSEYGKAVVDGRSKSQASFAWALTRISVAKGRLATAERWGREAVNLRRQEPRPFYLRWALADLAWALALQGKAVEAAAVLAEHDAVPFPTDAPFWANTEQARAWTAVAAHRVTEAVAMLEEIARRAAVNGELAVEARALHDLVRLGCAPAVALRLAELAKTVEGDLVQAWSAHAAAAADDDAVALDRASHAFEAVGALLLAAEAGADAVAALRRAGAGRAVLPAQRRAAELAGRCEGAVTPALSAVAARSALTAREREVAALAALGLSNREITEQLFLSVRTVENQLQRAYEKLGIRSRTELAGALHGL